jgi:outer membrane autotransporter protein
MLIGAVIGYGRQANAACLNVGGSNFECSGASTAQSISAANANVSTLAGFSVTTSSANALSITGSGDLFYTDANASPLTANFGNGLNVSGTVVAPGSIAINTNGVVVARNYGIRARNMGTGALSITANGDVTSTGTGVTSLSRGIVAVNSGTDITVTTGAGADISARRYGILARNYGTGATSVTVNGDVTASGTTGGDFAILARGNAAVAVTTAAGTTVAGQEGGIFARTSGASPLTITVDGDVSGGADDGIYARSDGGGLIAITVGAGGSVSSSGLQSDDFAIQAATSFGSSGPVMLTVGGALNGGAGGAVQLWSLDDRFELHPTAAVDGTVFAGAGTDTFVLGGTGTGSFDVSAIGPGQQYQEFELFLKEDDSHWTLTGTNTGIPAFVVDGGLLSVSGLLENTAFTVNDARLELLDTGAVGSVDIAGTTGVFDISGTTAGATLSTLSGVAGSSVVLGNQTLTLSNASGIFAGAISGNGGLILSGGIEALTGTNTYLGPTMIDGGTLLVNGSIASSAVTVNSGGTLSGTGTVGPLTVASGGLLSPGDPRGTLTVNGNLVLAAGSMLRMEVNGTGDVISVSGKVNVTGSNLELLVGSAPGTPVTQYLLIDNGGGDPVVGTFASATNNLPFLDLFVLYGYNGDTGELTGGNDVGVRLLRNDVDYCYVAVSANQCSVTGAYDSLPFDDPLLYTVVTQSAEGAREAFDALSGEIHATTRGILLDDSRYVREAVLGRLLQADYADGADPVMALGYAGDPVLTDPADDPDRAFWAHAYGARGTVASDMNAAEARRDIGGFVLGADSLLWGDWRMGLAGGYALTDTLVEDRNSTASVESFHLAAYAGGPLGPVALRLGSAAAWYGIDTTREIAYPGFSEQETASYTAMAGQIFAEAGLPVDIGLFAVEPFAGLTRVQLDTGDATEQGGIAALFVPGNEMDLTYATLGLRATTATHGFDMDLKPHAALVWQHAFGELIPHVDPGFISTGTNFSSGIDGAPIARDSLLLEAGVDWDLGPSAALGLTYSGKFAPEIEDHALYARFTGRF